MGSKHIFLQMINNEIFKWLILEVIKILFNLNPFKFKESFTVVK